MKRTFLCLAVLTLAPPAFCQDTSLAALEPMGADAARAKAEAWLKEAGKTDAATLARVGDIWKQSERTVLDRLVDTFALGNDQVGNVMGEARNAVAAAPTAVPALLKDDKQSAFFRANLGLAFARSLNGRRVHEEALEVLKLFNAHDVVDPSAYLFNRAITEHALLQKKEASTSISRLLEDAVAPAERYKTVGILMLLDMQTWQDKDLGAVARKMDNIERRLELARGGPVTQKLQKEVIARLDELIKELENKAKQQQQGGGGGGGGGGGKPQDGCPDGGSGQSGPPSGTNKASNPATDSGIAGGKSTGDADKVNAKKNTDNFGRAMEREQEQRVQRITPSFSPRHRLAIENYYRKLSEASAKQK